MGNSVNEDSESVAYDAVVVGSGFGGSVTAARLAEAGLRVLVLERGPWFGPAGEAEPAGDAVSLPHGRKMHRLLRSMRWPNAKGGRELRLSRKGLWEIDILDELITLTASGVGGGSLIFNGIQAQPEDDFFEGFPAEITGPEMRPYYDKVRAMLRPSPLPGAAEDNALFEAAARAAGLGPVNYPDIAIAWGKDASKPEAISNSVGVLQNTSNFEDSTFWGCADKSKTTLDLTYIPFAVQHGAQLNPLCEVEGVSPVAAGYEVVYRDHRSGTTHRVTGKRVILAAGTLNTARILFRARDVQKTLPRISSALGTNFSGNGDLITLLAACKGDPEHGFGSPAVPSVQVRSESGAHRFMVVHLPVPLGPVPLPAILKKMLAPVLLFGIGRTGSSGSISLDGNQLRAKAGRSMASGMLAAMESVMESLAPKYQAKLAVYNIPSGRGRSRLFTVHPLGGASIGQTPGEGVVDHRGEVFGYPGLYVADGSLYPTDPGIPPSMTIAALAERQASLMISGSAAVTVADDASNASPTQQRSRDTRTRDTRTQDRESSSS
ncbi:GMC oxidoreductase [Rhodococcus opacus]|uniref:GMC oxidoreductase n=1 Tax=Rhodococcus opacus TaxID=37919 RepID=UPI002235DDF9|nr:GMC family oxidoreductase [Rhodococcus opacus]UZG60280.1 GMC family oxidoreductase [Rhodococcus opacus]